MSILLQLIALVITVYVAALIVRVVFEMIQMFARSWRPRGLIVIAVESVYSVTEPPLRLARKYIKPLDLGGMRLDLGFTVVFIVLLILQSVFTRLALTA